MIAPKQGHPNRRHHNEEKNHRIVPRILRSGDKSSPEGGQPMLPVIHIIHRRGDFARIIIPVGTKIDVDQLAGLIALDATIQEPRDE